MNDGLVAFVALVGSALAAIWTITYGWSWVARERFLTEMTILADDIEDEVIAGTLPEADCVWFAWAKARGVAKDVKLVSFSTAAATEISAPGLIGKRASGLSYAGLTSAQRRRMHQYEDRFVASIARYLIHGSRLWFVLLLAPRVLSNVLRSRKPTPPPKQMAEDLSRAMDKSRVQTPKGPRVSNQLIPH